MFTHLGLKMANSNKSNPKRIQRDYTLGFKLAVVEQVEKGELTYKQAQKQYGIQGRSTVLVWLRKHGKLDWTNPFSQKLMSKIKETPAQQIKRLERQLADATLKNEVMEEVLERIDKECGSSYQKKYYAKLSGKERKKTDAS